MSTVGGRLRAVLTAGGLALVAAGLVVWLSPSPEPAAGDVPGATPTSGSSPGTPASPTAEPILADWEPGAPRRVLIPVLGVDASVVPVGAPNDTLVPPTDPQQLGWWADGARPGAERGSALVAGHTVRTGGGALDDLETLERGDRVVVRTERGRVVYRVAAVRVFSKGRVADHAERLFSQEAPGRLVLVTCEDWDGTRYLSNVVVTATPYSD